MHNPKWNAFKSFIVINVNEIDFLILFFWDTAFMQAMHYGNMKS